MFRRKAILSVPAGSARAGNGQYSSLSAGERGGPGLSGRVRRLACVSAFCLLVSSAGCGYHMAGRAARVPPDVRTIAVPVFKNQTPRYRIEQRVAAAVTRELIERTSFRVTPYPAQADAVLDGTVTDVRSGVITFDPNTGRATTQQIQVTADVELVNTRTKKVLYANHHYIFREQYQISQNSSGLFEEDQPALDRLSQDLARTLVTDILENF